MTDAQPDIWEWLVDYHRGYTSEMRQQAADEIERLRDIGRRLLYHDERGQGVGWQEAMNDLAAAIKTNGEEEA